MDGDRCADEVAVMILLHCASCNTELRFIVLSDTTLSDLRDMIEAHGCWPRRVRWTGIVAEVTVQ